MSIHPEGESLKKAIAWISEQRNYNHSDSIYEIIKKACLVFDLTPKDEAFLYRRILKEDRDNI